MRSVFARTCRLYRYFARAQRTGGNALALAHQCIRSGHRLQPDGLLQAASSQWRAPRASSRRSGDDAHYRRRNRVGVLAYGPLRERLPRDVRRLALANASELIYISESGGFAICEDDQGRDSEAEPAVRLRAKSNPFQNPATASSIACAARTNRSVENPGFSKPSR